MKPNKKYTASLLALLSATAVAGAFAASTVTTSTTSTTGTTRSTFGRFGSRVKPELTDAQKAERKDKMTQSLATALDTTKESVLAQLTRGTSIQDIIKASGKDEATVKAKLEALRLADITAKLKAEVTAGTITQAQADQRLTDMQNHTGRGFGRRHHNHNNADDAPLGSTTASTKVQ